MSAMMPSSPKGEVHRVHFVWIWKWLMIYQHQSRPVHIQSNPVPFGSSTAVCYVVGNSPLGVCTERERPRYIVGVNRITYPESFCIFVVLGNFIIIIIRGSAARRRTTILLLLHVIHSHSGAKAGEYYIIHFIWCVCKILPRRTIKRWW